MESTLIVAVQYTVQDAASTFLLIRVPVLVVLEGYEQNQRRGRMTENKTQLLGDLGFLIIQFMIITIKLGNVITSKLVHHKTVDKSPAIMILEQGTLKTVILKYEIAEYNNPLDYMRMKRTQQKNLTPQNIIDAIRWGSDLFDSIAADTYHYTSINNANPRYCVDLSRKQYYARLSKLVKAGLVKRVNGRYSLTFFGIVIYDVQLEFRRAVDSHLKPNEPESSNIIPFQTKS